MNPFCYAMRLRGNLRTQKDGQFTAMTRSDDFHIFSGDLVALEGTAFRSTVEMGDQKFTEYGSITFEDGSALNFEGEGTIEDTADRQKRGAICWTLISGEGVLVGATGFITSNFMVTEEGEVIDHHVAVIYPK